MTLVYGTGDFSVEELYGFLTECDTQFSPLLSSRVNLIKYSEKLILNSILFHARENNKTVGIMAFYANDTRLDYAFISLICVWKGYERKGIGSKFIDDCISIVKKKGIKSIRLEVDIENQDAISFYAGIGFHIENTHTQSYIMVKIIH